MSTYKPNRNDLDDLDFGDNSIAYRNFEESVMKALTIHPGNENYFEGYVE